MKRKRIRTIIIFVMFIRLKKLTAKKIEMFDVCLKIHIDTGYQGRNTMIFILGQIVFNPVKLFGPKYLAQHYIDFEAFSMFKILKIINIILVNFFYDLPRHFV